MKCNCPVCGSVMAGDNVVILRDRGLIVRGDVQAALTAQEFELFVYLYENRPRVCSAETLMNWLYQLDDHEPEKKIIDVFICKVRKKLRGSGIVIDTSWGKGYGLRVEAGINVIDVPAVAQEVTG